MCEKMLEVKSLTKVFGNKQGGKAAVRDLSFLLDKGECLGIIGESGSGKSTAAHMIAGLLQPTSGEMNFHGKHMQMVFQNPFRSFSPCMTIFDSICEGLRYKSTLPKKEIRKQAHEAMEMVQLDPSYKDRYRSQLSGGECQRAAIARAIMLRPEMLIFDEATSALDVSVQAQIVCLLSSLRKELNMSYLFITHDIALVSSLSDRVAVMYQGGIVETGNTMDVIHKPKMEYTRSLIDSVPLF